MSHPILTKYRFHILIIAVILLAIFLRTARLDKQTIFSGDEGMDLIVVWNMEYNHHRPLIGPFLSVENIFIPPTYYYIVWLFYHFDPTPEGVIRGFFFMNIMTIVLLMMLSLAIAGPRAAVICGVLLALSWQFIAHGRQFWQPFPVQLFVALWLLSLWYAYKTSSFALFAASGLFFFLAISVYPTTVLLVPLAGYHMYRWFRTTTYARPFFALFFAASTALLTALPVFLPQIVFAFTHEFPTFRAIAEFPPLSVFLVDPFEAIRFHLLFLVDNVFNVIPLGPEWQSQIFLLLYLVAFILLATILGKKDGSHPIIEQVRQFFPPGILAIGLPLLFYSPDINNWRLWGVLSIEIVVLAIMISEGLRHGKAVRILSIAILVSYAITNGMTTWNYVVKHAKDDIAITRKAAKRIQKDITANNVSPWTTTVRYADRNPTSYNSYRVLYWLVKDRIMTVPLLENGNVTMTPKRQPILNTLYLICDKSSYSRVHEECAEEFEKWHPDYALERIMRSKFLPIYVFAKRG